MRCLLNGGTYAERSAFVDRVAGYGIPIVKIGISALESDNPFYDAMDDRDKRCHCADVVSRLQPYCDALSRLSGYVVFNIADWTDISAFDGADAEQENIDIWWKPQDYDFVFTLDGPPNFVLWQRKYAVRNREQEVAEILKAYLR